jgi:hypothetical protein
MRAVAICKYRRKTKRPLAAASCLIAGNGSALASFEARIALANHEHLAAATHDFAVTVALLGGFKRGQDFHVDLPTRSGRGEARNCNALYAQGKALQTDRTKISVVDS